MCVGQVGIVDGNPRSWVPDLYNFWPNMTLNAVNCGQDPSQSGYWHPSLPGVLLPCLVLSITWGSVGAGGQRILSFPGCGILGRTSQFQETSRFQESGDST